MPKKKKDDVILTPSKIKIEPFKKVKKLVEKVNNKPKGKKGKK